MGQNIYVDDGTLRRLKAEADDDETLGEVVDRFIPEVPKHRDPVYEFVEERIESDPASRVPKEDIFNAYYEWAEANGRRKLHKTEVAKRLIRREKVDGKGRIRVDGGRVRVYKGIRLVDAD